MKTGWTGVATWLLVVGLGGGAAAPAQASAQVESERQSCRCVDEDGQESERCVCVRMPRLANVMAMAMRPRLGVSVDGTQDAEVDALGVRLSDVLPDSPAAEAGLRDGDIITHVDGRSLLEPLPDEDRRDFDPDDSMPVQRFLALARALDPGESVDLRYRRGSEARSTTVHAADLSARGRGFGWMTPEFDAGALEERMRGLTDRMREMRWRFDDDSGVAPRVRTFEFEPGADGALRIFRAPVAGLELARVNAALGSYFGVDRGVLVLDVDEGAAWGLRPGDVILDIGGRAVDSPDRVRRILDSYGADEAVPFRVRREGRVIDVSGRAGR